jgi:hypothetical protein
MKKLCNLAAIVCAVFIFSSCQKELNFPAEPILPKDPVMEAFKAETRISFVSEMGADSIKWYETADRLMYLSNLYPVIGQQSPLKSVAGLNKFLAFERVDFTTPNITDTTDEAILNVLALGVKNYTTTSVDNFHIDFMTPSNFLPNIDIQQTNIVQVKKVPGLNTNWAKAYKVWMIVDFSYKTTNNELVKVTGAKSIMTYFFKVK